MDLKLELNFPVYGFVENTVPNILLQGTKEMSIGSYGERQSGSLSYPAYLRLRISPRCIPQKVRIQAAVSIDQNYSGNRQNPVFEVAVRDVSSVSSGTINAFDTTNRLGIARERTLQFSRPASNSEKKPAAVVFNYVELDIDLEVSVAKEICVGFRVGTFSGTSFSSVSDTQIRLFSVTLEANPLGCDGVTVQSLDGRLVSTSGTGIIDYPMLFLGREPVKEDCQGRKEVLVFQDRATTIRVTPQPIVLNEENNYSALGIVESNGNWALYEYDTQKFVCRLESGLPVTSGAGNDILRLDKNSNFTTYGLYERTLLFTTDTADEPYIVPVVMDYAVPLAAASPHATDPNHRNVPQTRILEISFNDDTICTDLSIFRDRLWKIVGFPSEYFTIGRLEGTRETVTPLCIRSDYPFLGTNVHTFTLQSGSKRVIIAMEVTITSHFSVSKPFVILEQDNSYTHLVYVRRRGYGTGIGTSAAARGYTINPGNGANSNTTITYQNHEIQILDSSGTRPAGCPDIGEPADTLYDTIQIRYTTDPLTQQAGTAQGPTLTFRATSPTGVMDRTIATYRNISLYYEIRGTDNRPSGAPANGTGLHWLVKKELAASAPATTNAASMWGYITPNYTGSGRSASTTFHVKGNKSASISKTEGGRAADTGALSITPTLNPVWGTGTLQINAIKELSFTVTSTSEHLRAFYELYVQFSRHQKYMEPSNPSANLPSTEWVETTAHRIQFEVRHPHFLKVSNSYLQWDNNWVQHHWLLTNPDAEIDQTAYSASNTTGLRVESLTGTSESALGRSVVSTAENLLLKFTHAQSHAKDLDVYRVTATSKVPVSLVNGAWLSSPTRNVARSFKVAVYYPELIRNEIIPHFDSKHASAQTQIIDIVDRSVATTVGAHNSRYSGFSSTPNFQFKTTAPALFNRNNRSRLDAFENEGGMSITFTTANGRKKLRDLATLNGTNTHDFTVEFDRAYMIRSWSYTVQGRENLAVGFLIEGQLEKMHESHEWEVLCAVSDFDSSTTNQDINGVVSIDYVTVNPRPWTKLRIRVTQVCTSRYSKSSDQITASHTSFRVGQFQFYTGYPLLGRSSSLSQGNQTVRQLSTQVNAQLVVSDPTASFYVSPICDGRLFEKIDLDDYYGYGNNPDTGIGAVAGYPAGGSEYWDYQLVNQDASGSRKPSPFLVHLAFLGITLEGATPTTTRSALTRLIGIRYDTGIVADYPTASALVVGVSATAHNTGPTIREAADYESIAVISAWRYLGLGRAPLAGVVSTALDNTMRSTLYSFALAAQRAIYKTSETDPLVVGTIIMIVDTMYDDYRLLQYTGGTGAASQWTNIGQDIILNVQNEVPGSSGKTSTELLANNGILLTNIVNGWTRPGRNKVAFTNPGDKKRLLYTQGGSNGGWANAWSDGRDYSFEPYKGRQYYQNVDESGIRSLRIHIPGLADTYAFSDGGLGKIRALVGELQLFELFRNPPSGGYLSGVGVDITCQDILVTPSGGQTQSVKYGEVISIAQSNTTSISVRCVGVAINGSIIRTSGSSPTLSQRVFAQTHSHVTSGTLWTTTYGDTFNITLESNFTATSVTLFYRTGDNNHRHLPFFTFTILRQS